MNTKTARGIRALTRGALIASLYVALTYLASIFGLSSGVIQFRISEALTILPVFMPEAIPGLFIGCILSNLITPAVHPLDIVFGPSSSTDQPSIKTPWATRLSPSKRGVTR